MLIDDKMSFVKDKKTRTSNILFFCLYSEYNYSFLVFEFIIMVIIVCFLCITYYYTMCIGYVIMTIVMMTIGDSCFVGHQ